MGRDTSGAIVIGPEEFERISGLVPPEYLLAWNWFLTKENTIIPQLPFGKGRPEGMPMSLARQSAIHCPSYASLPSKGAGKKHYALSVYSLGRAVYPDGDVNFTGSGLWALEYHEQRGKDPKQDYNDLLFSCMDDGVPVGVMVKSPNGGYTVMGLAMVLSHSKETHLFTLAGPVLFQNPVA